LAGNGSLPHLPGFSDQKSEQKIGKARHNYNKTKQKELVK